MIADDFLRMTKLETPWGFASFDAATMNVIGSNVGGLRRWLEQGLEHRQLGYWMGQPLAETTQYLLFQRLVSSRYRQVVRGDILACSEFRDRLPGLLHDRKTMWVGMTAPLTLGFSAGEHLHVSKWADFERVRRMTFPRNAVVLIDAGAVGTVLAWHWYARNPRCTILDVKGVWNSSRSSLPEAVPASPPA